MFAALYRHKGKILTASIAGAVTYWYFSDTSNNEHSPDTIKQPNPRDPEASNYFKNKDGLWLYTKSWLPKDMPIKAVVFLVHGLGEHSNRVGYQDFASILTQAGYAVFSLDHQGHGKSNGTRGHVKNFSDFCSDFTQFVGIVKTKFPGLPTFACGHSMGGAILLLTVINSANPLFNGLILSSPACCAHIDPLYSETLRSVGNVIHKVLPKATLVSIPSTKISRNDNACATYKNDPLVYHGLFPISVAAGIQQASEILWNRFHDITVPFIVVHGTADAIVHQNSSKHLYERSGSTDKEIFYLEGAYHEIWEDSERGQVFEKLVQWLNRHATVK